VCAAPFSAVGATAVAACLGGEDSHSGRSFERRRGWLEGRTLERDGVFAIDIVAYAVMSNNDHVILYIDANHAGVV